MNFYNNYMRLEELTANNNFLGMFGLVLYVIILLGMFNILIARLYGDRNFRECVLAELLENASLSKKGTLWFIHDRISSHFSIIARQFLDASFVGHWFGYASPQSRPPRSSD